MGTVVAAWPASLVRYAERQGVGRARVLAAAGVTEQELGDPDGRVTDAQNVALWREVERALGDGDLGLSFAASLHSARPFGMVGYLGRAARTWGDVVASIERFHLLLGLAGAKVLSQADVTTLTVELHPSTARERHPAEAAIATLVVMSRRATGQPMSPLEVRLRHPRPLSTSAHERLFGCPVLFDASVSAVDWSAAQLATPLVTTDPGVKEYLEQVAAKQLEQAKASATGLVATVAEAVSRALPHGSPTLAQMGKRLGHSSRSLQRKLRDEGATFAGVVDDVRRRLALELVESDRLTLSEIAARLGFADASAFRRAFRRWQGTSPREERRRRRGRS